MDSGVVDLLAAHVVGGRPAPPEHEWAVDDLHLILARFAGELSLVVAGPLDQVQAAALAEVARRHAITYSVWADPPVGGDDLADRLAAAGVPPAQRSLLAACARQGARLFVQAPEPDPAYQDRVYRQTEVYIVDPTQCLSHLFARLLGQSRGEGGETE